MYCERALFRLVRKMSTKTKLTFLVCLQWSKHGAMCWGPKEGSDTFPKSLNPTSSGGHKFRQINTVQHDQVLTRTNQTAAGTQKGKHSLSWGERGGAGEGKREP